MAAAGIDAKGNAGFSETSSLVSGWSESGASFAVIAGSDTDYETMLEPAIAALKAAGCPLVLVAGRPGDREGRLREAGVSDFVYAGADVLSAMGRVLDSIGVGR
jgi:methylmalonyl-CoA mutase